MGDVLADLALSTHFRMVLRTPARDVFDAARRLAAAFARATTLVARDFLGAAAFFGGRVDSEDADGSPGGSSSGGSTFIFFFRRSPGQPSVQM